MGGRRNRPTRPRRRRATTAARAGTTPRVALVALVALVAAGALGAAGCTGSEGGSSTTATTSTGPATTNAAATRLVDVDGHKVAITCTGAGPKTVVFVGDIGQDGSQSWGKSKVPAGLAGKATVCTYDRPGLGASEPGPLPRSVTNQVTDLAGTITVAGLNKPVVLVAQGYGAHIARQFARDHPRDVAGLVLVDPPLWGLDLQLPADAPAGVKAEYDTLPAINQNLAEYGAGTMPPPPAPTVVIGVDGTKPALPPDLSGPDAPLAPTTTTFPLPDNERRHEVQRELAQKSPFGRFQDLTSAGSYAQYWAPEAVVEAVTRVLADSMAPR